MVDSGQGGVHMEQYRLREAAELLGISYQSLKLWIYQHKIRSVKTPGGHHRIPRTEVERLSGQRKLARLKPRARSTLEEISGRNKLLGIVTNVKYSGLLANGWKADRATLPACRG